MCEEKQRPFSISDEQLGVRFGLGDFLLESCGDYETVRPQWLELNQTYKDGELSLDWEAHRRIWAHFYAIRSGRLWILCASRSGHVRAIFPMVKETDSAPWSLCDEFIIGREYFCPPDLIHRFADLLASIHQEDMSSFYIPDRKEIFESAPSGVVDLKADEDSYLSSLNPRIEKNLRRILRINGDLEVVAHGQVLRDEIAPVLRSQLGYWLEKKNAADETEYSYSRDKIHTDLLLMERAAEMNRLKALYIYERKQLVAANFAVKRGSSGIDDYLCLRDCSEAQKKRSLGIFAILQNMRHCRELGIRYYDLSAITAPYKEALINTKLNHYHLYKEQTNP